MFHGGNPEIDFSSGKDHLFALSFHQRLPFSNRRLVVVGDIEFDLTQQVVIGVLVKIVNFDHENIIVPAGWI